jgi:hypothetical protein
MLEMNRYKVKGVRYRVRGIRLRAYGARLRNSDKLGDILSIEADYFGFVLKDRSVLSSIRNRHPFLPNYHSSLASENINRIAMRIVKFWHQPVQDSAALLFNHVKGDFEKRKMRSIN